MLNTVTGSNDLDKDMMETAIIRHNPELGIMPQAVNGTVVVDGSFFPHVLENGLGGAHRKVQVSQQAMKEPAAGFVQRAVAFINGKCSKYYLTLKITDRLKVNIENQRVNSLSDS